MALRARRALQFSISPDSPYRKASTAASAHSARNRAPVTDTSTSAFMSGRRRASDAAALGAEGTSPAAMPTSSSTKTGPSTPCAPCACPSRVSTTPPPATAMCRMRPARSASPLAATSAWRPCASHHDSTCGAASHGAARIPSRETASATRSGPKASVSASTVMRPSTTLNDTPWTPSRPASASRSRAASSLQSRPSTRKSSFLRMVFSLSSIGRRYHHAPNDVRPSTGNGA